MMMHLPRRDAVENNPYWAPMQGKRWWRTAGFAAVTDNRRRRQE